MYLNKERKKAFNFKILVFLKKIYFSFQKEILTSRFKVFLFFCLETLFAWFNLPQRKKSIKIELI